MGFWPENLLFLEPVLLQPREGGQTRVHGVPFAAALFVIETRAARGAQTAAIALADNFHRQCQQHLFLEYIGEEQAFSLKKSDFGVVIFQPFFFGLAGLRKRLIEEVKILVDFLDYRLQATGTDHLNLGLQLAADADLTFQKLRRCGYFQRLRLFHFTDAVIDASRGVTFPDLHFADGKILDVEEHVCCASGAYAHAYPLFGEKAGKSRKWGEKSRKTRRFGQLMLLVPAFPAQLRGRITPMEPLRQSSPSICPTTRWLSVVAPGNSRSCRAAPAGAR